MEDMSFQDILKTPIGDIEAPKALPVGQYLGMVDGQPEYIKVGQNQTPAVNFTIKVLQAVKVDEKQLADNLNGASLQDKKIRHRLFVTKDAAFRLKQFLVDHLGIEPSSPRQPLEQLVPEAMGKQVIVDLGHQSGSDGTSIYNVVKATAHP